MRVDFIDVGQGDAALITSPTGKTVLVDGGPHESVAALTGFLRGRGVGPIDMVILTHRHADHLGGLATVVRTFGARFYLDAPFPHPSPAYDALLDALEAAKVPVRTATRGRVIDLGGGASITLLGPPEPVIVGSRSDVNANSVVLRLDYRTIGMLFAADAEAKTERWLLESGVPLEAAVLKVAHHGSRYSSSSGVSARRAAEDRRDLGGRGQRLRPPSRPDPERAGPAADAGVPDGHRWNRHGDHRRYAGAGGHGTRESRDNRFAMTTRTTAVFVDAIEGGRARMLLGRRRSSFR